MTYSRKIINGVTHVWSVMDNAWVTLAYWEYVNGRAKADFIAETEPEDNDD